MEDIMNNVNNAVEATVVNANGELANAVGEEMTKVSVDLFDKVSLRNMVIGYSIATYAACTLIKFGVKKIAKKIAKEEEKKEEYYTIDDVVEVKDEKKEEKEDEKKK